MFIVEEIGLPVVKYVQDVEWQSIGSRALLILALLFAGFVSSKIIAYISRRYVSRLERKSQSGISDTGIIRLRALDTKHQVVVAIARAALYTVLIMLGFHLLFPQEGSGLLGATLAFALIGFTLQPFVRDVVAGASMLAEEWYQVGDIVYIEPIEIRGVVEYINLRSTRLRTISGEKVMVHNSFIRSVSVSPKGVKEMSLEIFVRDKQKGYDLVKQVSVMLPNGPAQIIRPLKAKTVAELGRGEHRLWRIVCSAAVAPGREWLLDDFAAKLFQEHDSLQDQILIHGPVVYNSDPTGIKRLQQSVLAKHMDEMN